MAGEVIKKGNYPLTVGTQKSDLVDVRFGDGDRYYLYPPKDINMRVPDQIRNTVLFVRLEHDAKYKGTGFIVTVPGAHNNHFAFMVTARHVAEKLQGKDWVARTNRKDGKTQRIIGRPNDPWWFHPTDKNHVDAAVTLFSPLALSELDIESIPIGMFVDDKTIEEHDLGVGDEIFITGLFSEVQKTTKNIPIVRTGTVAMIPGEKIPYGDGLIEAYLIESRSIGGLSGSPVFIRETVKMPVSFLKPGIKLNAVNDPTPGGSIITTEMQGTGRFYFFGSIIGHWDLKDTFTFTQAEAVNMGISPVVPAHKIKEIIMQPELEEMMKQVNEELQPKKETKATLDYADDVPVFTSADFEAALKKVSRKVKTK